MSHADRILTALDEHLDSTVELTLYGRAALQLGFANPPPEFAQSHDIDAVFWIGQAQELGETGNFWEAVDQVNQELADQELYISHFFQEDQVILTPEWLSNRIPIHGEWRNLRLFRLGDEDLLLTKLMRNDPIDQYDARFIVARAAISQQQLEELIARAQIPDIPEIYEEFQRAVQALLPTLG